MTRTILFWLLVGLAVLFAFPVLLMIADGWAWVVIGETFTGIEWTGDRVSVAWVLLFPAIGAAIGAAAVSDEKMYGMTPPRARNSNPEPTYPRPPMPPAVARPHIPQPEPERRGWKEGSWKP